MDQRQWHVIDSAGTQQGPMPAAELVSGLRAGRLSGASLAWREGMANWRPLRELAAELGLDPVEFATAAPPPPPSPAPGADPANPYAPMPHAGLVFRGRNDNDIVYAGFLRRWAALFIDQMVLTLPLIVLVVVIGGGMGALAANGQPPGGGAAALLVVVYLLWLLAWPLYFAVQESSAAQATLGKRAMGIKVTDLEGRRLGFGQALGRWFAAALSYLTMYIGFLMAAFTEKKQALHDIVAGTLVVDRWAYTEHPERQKRETSGCLIAFLILMLLVPIGAILAAISISQYQDYVIRSQVSEGAALVDGVKVAVGEYVNNHEGEFPADNEAAGLAAPEEISGSYVSSVDVGAMPGQIEVTYSSQEPFKANARLDGERLVFIAELGPGSISWQCTSEDLPQKFCPSSCVCTGSNAR